MRLFGLFKRKRSAESKKTASRTESVVFGEYMQMHLIDGENADVPNESENWTAADVARGFAGNSRYRMLAVRTAFQQVCVTFQTGTVPPETLADREAIVCDFLCETGQPMIRETTADEPVLWMRVEPGLYNVHHHITNPGIEPPLVEEGVWEQSEWSFDELRKHDELERHDITLVRIGDLPS